MSASYPNSGHRQRLRQRFIAAGINAFAPHELLELLLTYAIPQRDVKPLAKELIAKFGSLSRVLNAPLEQLVETPGIKENSAVLLMMINAMQQYQLQEEFTARDLIETPLAAIKFIRSKIAAADHETLLAIYMNSNNYVIKYDVLSGGSGNLVLYPEQLARNILLCGASGVLLAHNHPNGNVRPSAKDLETTHAVKEFLEKLGLRLIDHLIVTKVAHLSLLNRIGCIFQNYMELPLELPEIE